MKKTTTYLSLAIAGLAMLLVLLAPLAAGKARAESVVPAGEGIAKAPATDDAAYWYFVASYSDSDKRVSNTFYATGTSLKVYYKVRIALDGFQGDLQGTAFASREEADQDRAAKWPNVTVTAV